MSEGAKIDFALVNAERLRREPQTAILNEHRHLHGLAELGEVDCEELERIHKLVVDEMTRRGLEHNSPLECKAKAGLKLNEPHAYLVWKGKKKSIALPADDGKGLDGHLVGIPLVLCQNGAAGPEAYGEAILGNPAAMTPAQFDLPEYADCHCVRPEERREWWDGVKQFYVYPIKSFAKYEHPRPVLLQSGCKCYLPDVRFKQYTPPTAKEQEVLRQSERLPKQIILTPRAVSLTGSMLYGNHEPRDVDMVIVGAEWRPDEGQFVVPLTPTFKEKLERVLRAVYQTGNSVQYISEGEGPTFDHLPLYALALVRLPRLEVEHVSEMEPEMAEVGYDKDGAKALTATAVERELRGASPTVRRQALQSYTDDAVVPGRPFVPLKPMRPAKEGQRQVFSRFADYVESLESWPEYVSAKRDGMRVTFHRRDGKVTAYSDDGKNTTSTLPELVKRLEEIKGGDYVLDSEVELWRDEGGGQHYPREAASGAIHSGEGTADLIANVFDVLYWDGKDLHKQPFVERLKVLDSLPADTKSDDALKPSKGLLNVIPHYPVKDRAELEKLCMRTAYKPGVEGVVVKRADGDYPLDGDPGEPPVWVKFHKSAAFNVVVLQAIETKVPGTFNYLYGIPAGDAKPAEPFELNGKTYMIIGKTFSSSEQHKVGDEIEVESETVNFTQNDDGTVEVSFWVPTIIKSDGEKYSPNQPRDEAGRFGSSGGGAVRISGSASDRAKSEAAFTHEQLPDWAKSQVEHIVLETGPGNSFMAGGQNFETGGTYQRSSKTVTIYKADEVEDWDYLINHEAGHGVFDQWWQEARDTDAKIYKDKPDWFDAAGNLKPQFKAEYDKQNPLAVSRDKFIIAWTKDGEDGITKYSKAWAKSGHWSETAAEMSRIYLSSGDDALKAACDASGASKLREAFLDTVNYWEGKS